MTKDELDIGGSAYALLKTLVDEADAGRCAVSLINSHDMDENYPTALYQLLMELAEHGYVSLHALNDYGYVVELEYITQKGADVVYDHERRRTERAQMLKKQHSHDYKVALVGAVVGGVLGLIGGCFSSEFMAWFRTIWPL